MAVVFNDEEYLNVNESIEFVAGGSFFVFNQLRAKVRLHEYKITGKGRSKWYKRADLEELKKMIVPYPVES